MVHVAVAEAVTTVRDITVRATGVEDMEAEDLDKDLIDVSFSNQPYSKLCLEGNTERSESNPGRSLGITIKKREAVLKTVPTYDL